MIVSLENVAVAEHLVGAQPDCAGFTACDWTSSNARSYSGSVSVSTGHLVALQRSAAMLTPGQSQPVDRDVLYSLCSELIEARQLLARLGADLQSIAARAQR